KSLATSDVSGILNAPALNPLRRVFCFFSVSLFRLPVLVWGGLILLFRWLIAVDRYVFTARIEALK
ncbi:hypothetical protein, partial [Escherichia coli]|uniref:hypothetical protein n=1 Tax=Escherichia coli TaxID=562 RepID=UPI001BFCC419